MIERGTKEKVMTNRKEKRVPGFWSLAFRKSLPCKSQPSDVISDGTERSSSIGCLSNLRDAIHGSKRHKGKASNGGPKVVGSSTSTEIVLRNIGRPSRKGNGSSTDRMAKGLVSLTCNPDRPTCERSREYYRGSGAVVCQICGEKHKRRSIDAVESHRLSKEYAVSELLEGDLSRKIIEIICQTGQVDQSNKQHIKIETILKVHNMQNILTWFEDYRETVKIKARRQSKKVDPRCLADGNELLRFYATTVACSLGRSGGSSGLCNMVKCGVCRILRNGFSANNDFVGRVGIFATSTSERALDYVEAQLNKRKALFVCRVIAGKIHSPLRQFEQGFSDSGCDSLAWKVGRNREAEELFVLSPRALLPCFVVIYKI
ncbi:Poly(ADP-ribose) polymerase, catalytic domain containing protein [Trema orientale]|uniref:Poly(ADP-ribose) polymerase, catalytic domain containing protein n=1 Tax=Trema orientale TaxID=63057 RepID=A0A2P5CV22_TREOI|nr:Poly(ADP-ribose) polymerase, catalytic domain containing protein [Trema orientale]